MVSTRMQHLHKLFSTYHTTLECSGQECILETGVPYLVLRRVWAALMILSFSQDWLLSRTTLHEQKMKKSKSLHASILFLMKYLSASYNFNSPYVIQSFGVLELHLRLVIMPFSSDSDSTDVQKGFLQIAYVSQMPLLHSKPIHTDRPLPNNEGRGILLQTNLQHWRK